MEKHTNWVADYRRADRLEREQHREIVAWLAPARGALVLDAGCGAGGLATVLAEAVGPEGLVTALDSDPEATAVATEVVAQAGLSGRVAVVLADVTDGEIPGAPFDLVLARWMIHHLPDQLAGVRRLAELVRPGGRIAVGEGGLPARSLPSDLGIGEPGLEARLDVARNRWFEAHVRAELPDAVRWTRGWPALLTGAGLHDVETRTFLFEAPAQPGSDAHATVRRRLERMADPEQAAFVEPEDRTTLARLLEGGDTESIDRREDLYLMTTTSVHRGTRPN